MRIARLCLAVCGLAFAASTAHAQLLNPTIGAGGGPSFATGNFGNAVNTGYNILAFVGVDPGLLPFGARLDGMFNHFGVKDPAQGHSELWSLTANAVFQIPEPVVTPYAILGLGYYYNDVSFASGGGNFSLGASGSHFGLNGGVGARVKIPELFSIFGEIRYHYVFTPNTATQFFPLTFGVQL